MQRLVHVLAVLSLCVSPARAEWASPSVWPVEPDPSE